MNSKSWPTRLQCAPDPNLQRRHLFKCLACFPRASISLKVCLGTTCHLKGQRPGAESLSHRLGVEIGYTTKDMKFTLETVGCLGPAPRPRC